MKLIDKENELVDKIFESYKNGPGFAVGVIKNNQFVHQGCYGLANLEHEVLITPNTKFDIASTSKQFTAMAVLLAVEDGKLSLSDSVDKYIPGFDKSIKIYHLISHTSGLRDYLDLHELRGDGLNFTPEMTVNLLKKQDKLLSKPGSEFDYCNSGYFLLSEVIKVATGFSLHDYSKKQIFDPLGMKDTEFFENQKKVVKNRASGYEIVKTENNEVEYHNEIILLNHVGDGALLTTLNDFLKFDNNFYMNILGNDPKNFIKKITTPFKLNNGKTLDYAFGLDIDKFRGIERVSHTGSWGGFNSLMWRFPTLNMTIIILSNLESEDLDIEDFGKQIADIYIHQHYEKYDEESDSSDDSNSSDEVEENSFLSMDVEYAGHFYCQTLETVWQIHLESDLFINLDNYGRINLILESKNEFSSDYGFDGKFNIQNDVVTSFYITDEDESYGKHHFKRIK